MLKKFLIGTVVALALLVGVTASAADYGTVTLKVGSKGPAVVALQTLVGALPIDGSFGPITKAKVMIWQQSNGLVADGLFGIKSKTVANGGSVVVTPNNPNAVCPAGFTCTSNSTATLSGEGSVKDFSLGSPEESSASEGQKDMEIAAFDVELENDGSLKLDRFDLYMGESDTAASDDPWDYFTKATLLADGKEIASMDVSSKSDWSEFDGDVLTTATNEYRLRFAGLNTVLKSDETTTISVAFDMASSIESADDGTAVWDVTTEADSFRFVDATGYMFTDGEVALDDSFNIDIPEVANLDLASASNDPDALTIEVDTDTDTNGVTIGIFDIEESNNTDANITDMTVTLATNDAGGITDVVKKLYIYNGSTLVGEERVTTEIVTFDNIDLDVAGDDVVTLTIKADIDDTNDAARYVNGATLAITAVNLTDYTDEYDNDETDIGAEGGSYASETHHLYATGIAVSDFSSVKTVTTTDATGVNNKISYAITYKVTAFGDDFYMPKTIVQGTSSTSAGLTYTVYDETAVAVTTSGTESASAISSSADTVSSYFKIAKGETETFTATISVATNEITVGDYIHVQLDQVGYDADQTGVVTEFDLTPTQDYDTASDTLGA